MRTSFALVIDASVQYPSTHGPPLTLDHTRVPRIENICGAAERPRREAAPALSPRGTGTRTRVHAEGCREPPPICPVLDLLLCTGYLIGRARVQSKDKRTLPELPSDQVDFSGGSSRAR
jgi:hypothetical protein